MRKNLLLLAALFITILQQSNAQCTASIINVPHGNCANTDIELIASGNGTANGFTYSWTGPNGFTSNGQSVNIYYAQETASGFYKVIITNPSGCSSSDSTEVIKHPVPNVYTGGQAGGCEGTTTYISAQDFAGNYGPYTYLWDNGATTQTLAITHGGGMYPAPACYMTNVFGCTAPNYTTFMIYSYPAPAAPVIEAMSATNFCYGGSVTLTTANDPNVTYQWYKKFTPVSGATSSDYTASSGGNYSLTVENGVGCLATSNTIHAVMYLKPEAIVTAAGSLNICNGDSVILSANSGAGLTYQWRKFNVNVNNATSSSLYIKKSGNYRVVVTNQFGCSKVSQLTIATSNCRFDAETRMAGNIVSVYPNPSTDFFNLSIGSNDDQEKIQLIITDITGRKVSENIIAGNKINFQFGKDLPAGIYNAMLIRNNEVQTTRIVKTE